MAAHPAVFGATNGTSMKNNVAQFFILIDRISTICLNVRLSVQLNINSNMTSFFRFVNKRASYPFGIILLAHASVNVTDFSIGSINCVRHFPQT